MSIMTTRKFVLKLALVATIISGLAFAPAMAQNEEDTAAPTAKTKKLNPLLGPPVSIGTGGGGTLPGGMLLTAINFSFRNKDTTVGSGKTNPPKIDQQIYLGKIRYGVTDRFEVSTVIPFSFTNVHKPDSTKFHMDGFGDVVVAASYMFAAERFGDPVTASVTGGFILPTGEKGNYAAPANGSWGNTVKAGVKKDFNATHRLETEVGYSTFYNEGNKGAQKGDALVWNAQYRYMTDHNFDLGLESNLEKNFRSKVYGKNQTDAGLDWYAGPSANIAFPSINMWCGAGVFAGIAHDHEVRRRVEDVRFEFKIGKVWF